MKRTYNTPAMELMEFNTRLFTALGISGTTADPGAGMDANTRIEDEEWDIWDEANKK